MNRQRRSILKAAFSSITLGVALSSGLLKPGQATASDPWRKAFQSKTPDALMNTLFQAQPAVGSDIRIRVPDLAENGSVVPIEIVSEYPNTESIVVMVDNNPFPLAAKFDFHNNAQGYVSTRLRVAESSNIRVIVRAEGRVHSVSKWLNVTISGCDPIESPFAPKFEG